MRLVWVLALLLSACTVIPPSPEGRAAIKSGAPLQEAQAIDKAVYAVGFFNAAGEESGYWPCLRNHMHPILAGAAQSGATDFDGPGLSSLVTEAQTQCAKPHWQGFFTALREKSMAGGFDDSLTEYEAFTTVHDLWTQALVEKYQ
jgi:hypothetical protein